MRDITYIIGKPSSGKTHYCIRRFIEHIRQGYGGAHFDFSGNTGQLLLLIPPKRINDTILFFTH